MRTITRIIIHCADTPAHMDIGAAEIRQWHTDPKPRGRGWSDIGYHYVIRRNGLVETGRDLDGDGDIDEEIGAHAYGNNDDSLGICLVGGKPDFNFTFAQLVALVNLTLDLAQIHNVPQSGIIGHRDVNMSGKTCPTFDVASLFAALKPGE